MTTRNRLVPLAILTAALSLPAVQVGAAEPEAGIRGTLRDSELRPLAAALVSLVDTGESTRTDADGGFAFSGLAAGIYHLEAWADGYPVDPPQQVEVSAGETTEVTLTLAALAVQMDEIEVTSRYSLLRDEPIVSLGLDRQEIAALPHFGDDLYRVISALPGTSANDISARFHVRGGLEDETLVLLDGVELFEPFHLKDYQGVFSILDPEVIGGLDLIPGSFPAEYGDRLSGVVDMTTRRASAQRTSLGVSFSNAWAGSSGNFADDRGRWLASARRGYLDLILGFVGEDQGRDTDERTPTPRYWDLFGKLEYDLNPHNSVSFLLLAADDTLTFKERDGDEVTDLDTSYGNVTFAVGHLGIAGARTVVETNASAVRFDRDRHGTGVEPTEFIGIDDVRRVDVVTLRQGWNHDLVDRHHLKWGAEVRSFSADYDYSNTITDSDTIDDPRFPPPARATRFAGSFDGEHYGLYAADRMRVGKRLTVEAGVRYDAESLTDDREVSPRLNLVYELGRQAVLRTGWGRFAQSQRPHELEVEFGENEFQSAQHADHLTVGFEKGLARGMTIRLEAYRREIRDPRPRYETLFDPFNPFPETHPDLIRVAADRVVAEGAELYLKGRHGRKLDWWLSYALSSITDEIGSERRPRWIDQTHAVTVNANYHPSRVWNLSWVWTYHTGWPTTAISTQLVRAPEGDSRAVSTIGPFHQERHPDYHRLDLRVSRGFDLRRGRLALFLDVQNLYDQSNIRGLDVSSRTFVPRPDGGTDVLYSEEAWLGVMPSFGVSWEF